jgi:uncharacterized membrane protein YdjX (TVP38/TMEM64 family)
MSRRIGWLLGIGLAGFLALQWIGFETLVAAAQVVWARLEQAPPWLFFPTMALVCVLPVPITAFYLTAGPIYGVVPSLLWIVPTLVVNQLLGHLLATGILRPWIEGMIESHGYTVPRVTQRSDQILFTLVVRITPGFPYFFQNLILGIAGIERARYLLISLPAQMIYATGFVVLGRSAFEGNLGIAIGALSLIVVASISARLIHRHLRARTGIQDPSTGREQA